MQDTMDIGAQLLDVYHGVVRSVIGAIPRVVTALVMLIVMLVVAKLVERILRAVLTRLKFDALLEQSGIDKMLHRVGLRQSLNQTLPRLVYFLLLVLFARTGADVLGLTAISDAIGSFFGYLPNIIAAVLVLVVGSAASQFAGRTVAQAAEESGIDFAASLGSAVSGLILFIVGIMAVAQLKIDTEMVRIFTICSLAGGALAFGLSFGLGSREITRNILAGFYARKMLEVGHEVEVGGQRGVLRAILPTQILLEQDDTIVAIANAVVLEQVTKDRKSNAG